MDSTQRYNIIAKVLTGKITVEPKREISLPIEIAEHIVAMCREKDLREQSLVKRFKTFMREDGRFCFVFWGKDELLQLTSTSITRKNFPLASDVTNEDIETIINVMAKYRIQKYNNNMSDIEKRLLRLSDRRTTYECKCDGIRRTCRTYVRLCVEFIQLCEKKDAERSVPFNENKSLSNYCLNISRSEWVEITRKYEK